MNRNFGKLEDGAVKYAPINLVIGGALVSNPTDAEYLANGWLAVHAEKPTDKVGVYYIPDGWEERDGAIYRKWLEEPIVAPPPPVTRYSKLKLIVAAKAAGKWTAFKAFIASAGYEDEWAACQFLASNYPQFAAAKETIVAAGIATAEEVDAILAASVDEEVAA